MCAKLVYQYQYLFPHFDTHKTNFPTSISTGDKTHNQNTVKRKLQVIGKLLCSLKKKKKQLNELGNEDDRSARHPMNSQMLCKSHALVLMVCDNTRLPVADNRYNKYNKNTGPLLQFVKQKLNAVSRVEFGNSAGDRTRGKNGPDFAGKTNSESNYQHINVLTKLRTIGHDISICVIKDKWLIHHTELLQPAGNRKALMRSTSLSKQLRKFCFALAERLHTTRSCGLQGVVDIYI